MANEEIEKEITIYEEDAEIILSTLNSVYHYCLSYDLFNQYKNLSNAVQLSPLTKSIQRARNRMQSILEEHEAAKDSNSVDGNAEDVSEELSV